MTEKVALRGVSHRFSARGATVEALSNIDLRVGAGEFVAIVGPSGCGKSTLLNLVSGLTRPSEGRVALDGRPVSGLTPTVGYVTQADNLYPWRTVLQNVELPLAFRGWKRQARRERARSFLAKVGLTDFEGRYPAELSGGMRQRVNIVRTLVTDPEVILMDEPFGPLDAQTRLALQRLLLALWSDSGKTVIFITHDLGEAVALASRVAIMSTRPGTIKHVAPVDIGYPRDPGRMHEIARFQEIYRFLWDSLEAEMTPVTNAWATAAQ